MKNPPKDLLSPNPRKAYLDTLCSNSRSHIVELKPGKSKWKVVLSNNNAPGSLAVAVGNSD